MHKNANASVTETLDAIFFITLNSDLVIHILTFHKSELMEKYLWFCISLNIYEVKFW